MNPSSASILQFLWHTLAWGGGRKARLMNKRLDSVASNPEFAAAALRAAAAAARADPGAAYEILYPSGRTLLKYLRPAFFTKYLYLPVAEQRHTPVPSWIGLSRRTFARPRLG